MGRLANRVLLVGWDSADWRVISPLVDAGKLPNLARLIDGGVCGNLATLWPDLSPMLWTSIATGKRPYKHGILGFVEPDPSGAGVRPITNIGRRTKAVWNILSQEGLDSLVVGWWPSFPVEPIRGAMVSNTYAKPVGMPTLPDGTLRPWPMPPGTVHPSELADVLAALRVHPAEFTDEHIGPFVPEFGRVDQDSDHSLETIAVSIAESASMQAAITGLMTHEPWDFATVYFNAVDHLSHPFMKFHPPRLPWVDEAQFDIYRGVIEGVYRFHDMLLGVLLQLAGPDAHVIVMSDHGFEAGALRLQNVPLEPAGIAAQHRPFGMVVMHGPGIRKDERIYGGSILDICPTLLALFGLPVGRDMDGRVLVEAFESPPEIETIPSWDDVPGADGRHPADVQLDPVAAAESLQQLVDLGYIDAPNADAAAAVREAVRELDFNLARSYMAAGLHARAVPILEKIVADFPDEYRIAIHLVHCHQALGRTALARTTLDAAIAGHARVAAVARARLEELAAEYGPPADGGVPPPLPDPATMQEIGRLQQQAALYPWRVEFMTGSLLLDEGRPEEALVHFARCLEMDESRPEAHVTIARAHLALGKHADVDRSCRRALEFDPEYQPAHAVLAWRHFLTQDFAAAVEEALASLALRYFDPQMHALLGTALAASGRPEEAVAALRVAVKQNPVFPSAYRRLATVHARQLKDYAAADEYWRLARQAAERLRAADEAVPETIDAAPAASAAAAPIVAEATQALSRVVAPPEERIVVVSGLPRSGTSLLMQMLAAGGVPPVTDALREADESNPRGYLEHEAVKRLAQDAAWLAEARGRAVKVIVQLVPFLPPEHDYRVILMDREITEVLASQRAMLGRSGKAGAQLASPALAGEFARQRAVGRRWLEARGIPILEIRHRDCLTDPAAVAARVAAFLERPLDVAAMAAAVDRDLWRERAERQPAGSS